MELWGRDLLRPIEVAGRQLRFREGAINHAATFPKLPPIIALSPTRKVAVVPAPG
jgi:hypothetical protein